MSASNDAIAVARLPVDPGPAGWDAILPAGDRYAPLSADHTVDWLVVGAGFAGLSAARRLRQLCPGDRIAVVDATRVAAGPAGRNSGFMIDLPHDLTSHDYGGGVDRDRVAIAQNRAAIDFAAGAAADYGMDTGAFARAGKVNGAASARGDGLNRAYAAHLSALGEQHRWLDAAAMAQLTGTDYYTSGLFTPGTAMIQPAAYIRAMARGLTAEGIEIFEDTPVTALDRENGWVARTPGARLQAGRVILAVNGHAQSFGFYPGRLMHVFTWASMTRALTADEAAALGGAPAWGITPAHPLGTTVRRIEDHDGVARIIIRNRFTYEPGMEASPTRLKRIAEGHRRAFAARFPGLNAVEMEHVWGGRLCLSWNDAPAFGELRPGLFAACCQNGLGTVKGTLSGMRAAELAVGEASPALDVFQAQPGPARLPPGLAVGAPAYLRWQEWRAGREV